MEKDLQFVRDKKAAMFKRLEKAGDIVLREHNQFKNTPLKDYAGLKTLNDAIDSAKCVCDDYEQHMLECNEALRILRERLKSIPTTFKQKLEPESIARTRVIASSRTDVSGLAYQAKIAAGHAALANAASDLAELLKRLAQLEADAAESAAAAKAASDEAKRVNLEIEQSKAELERKKREAQEAERIRKKEEKEKKEEEKKRKEAERKRREEAERQAREEQKRKDAEERKRREEEEKRKIEEEEAEQVRLQEEERKRKEEEKRRKEAERKAEKERKRKEEEEQRQREEEERRKREEDEAEKRRIEEEEKRKQEEERKRIEAERKAEELRKRKEAEEKRKREEEERRKRLAEEEERRRLEAERKDPNNWPHWIFEVTPDATEMYLGCIIRALPGTMEREDITVECVPQMSGIFVIGEDESLVSNIIQIRHKDDGFLAEEPLSVILPHCAVKRRHEDSVIKQLDDGGAWVDLETSHVQLEDQHYELVECRPSTVSTFAVVTKIKVEQKAVGSESATINSIIDNRVCFVVKEHTFPNNSTVNLQVQPVDAHIIQGVRDNEPDCSEVIGSSHIISFQTAQKHYDNAVRASVPVTAARKKHESLVDKRLSDSKMKTDMKGSSLHFVTQDLAGCWRVNNEYTLEQTPNTESMMFEFDKPIKRFMIVRSDEKSKKSHPDIIATSIYKAVHDRHVKFLLRQNEAVPNEVVIVGSLRDKIEEEEVRLSEEGFSYGPACSESFIVREGQTLTVRLRANVQEETGTQAMQMIFNSHIKTKLEFKVVVDDSFGQRSSPHYYGFAQLFCEYGDKAPKQALLSELLVTLPKVKHKSTKPARVGFRLKTEDFVDEALLEYVASEIESEWASVAKHLDMSDTRIHAIVSKHDDDGPNKVTNEMLLTWVKTVEKSAPKADMLMHALVCSGRKDLADTVRERERVFNEQRDANARDYHLKQGFLRVCQEPVVIAEWRALGSRLGLDESTLNDIDQQYSSERQKCQHMLFKWRDSRAEDVTPNNLVKALNKNAFHNAADHVQRAMTGKYLDGSKA